MNTTLKTEFSQEDFKAVKSAISRHFKLREVETHHGAKVLNTWAQIEQNLGLPYTSSGIYAGLWVTNTQMWLDREKKYHYDGFAIDSRGNVVAVLSDNEENEISINI